MVKPFLPPWTRLACLALGLALVVPPSAVHAQAAKDPLWLYGLEFRVRKAGEVDFNKDTKRWTTEVFKDENNGNLVLISETGALTVVKTGADLKSPPEPKQPLWLLGLEYRVRQAGQPSFDKDTKRWSSEEFKDDNSGALFYILENGSPAGWMAPNPVAPPAKIKEPLWLHGLELKARKAGEANFTNAKAYGIEAFKDENSGSVIYVSDIG